MHELSRFGLTAGKGICTHLAFRQKLQALCEAFMLLLQVARASTALADSPLTLSHRKDRHDQQDRQ